MRNYIDEKGFWSEPGEPTIVLSRFNFYVPSGSFFLGDEDVSATLAQLKLCCSGSGSTSSSFDNTQFLLLSTSYYILSSSYYFFSSSQVSTNNYLSTSIANLEISLANHEANNILQFDIISDNIIDLQVSASQIQNQFNFLSASYYNFVSTSYVFTSSSFAYRIEQLELTASYHDSDINLLFDSVIDLRGDFEVISSSFLSCSTTFNFLSASYYNFVSTSFPAISSSVSERLTSLELTASYHDSDINLLFDSVIDLRGDFEIISSSYLSCSASVSDRIGDNFSNNPYSLDYEIRLLQMITQGTSLGFFKEVIPPGVPFPTKAVWWDSSLKTKKILELTASFGPDNKKFLTKSEYRLFESGVLRRTIEDNYYRNGPFLVSQSRIVT